MATPHASPPRLDRPTPFAFLAWFVVAAVLFHAFTAVGFSPLQLIEGLPNIGRIVGQMIPPDFSRLPQIGRSILETFQMAMVGTTIGVILSLPLAILATRSLSPHPAVYLAARAVVSFCRTVPDLVWALLFVIAVGLGPIAGTLAIAVDCVGFCGRFFAEAMEDTEPGPREALTALGAGRIGVVFSAVVPQAMPSFIATALFALEKATRSSVVLGLVGAGGIGIELKVAMDLFSYDLAATIILAVFALVIVVEQIGGLLRARII
jgi:phosphonate transport system permease protein